MSDDSTPRIDLSGENVEPPQTQPQTAPEHYPKPGEVDSTPNSDAANTPVNTTAAPAPAAPTANTNPPRRYRLSGGWLSLTFYMLAYPAGSAAYAFFDWVRSHNADGSLSEAWSIGVLTVEEGFPTADASLGTTAMNMCMSSIIYTPFLLLFYAYRVLYIDYRSEGGDHLTPPGDGLVAEAIRHAGVGWISNLMNFFFGKPRRNNSAMFVLKEAFAVCFIAYLFPILFLLLFVLINALRTQVPQTAQIRELPITKPFNYSITQSACHPYDLSDYATDKRGLPDFDWLNRNKPCGIVSFSPDFVPLDAVEQLASNMSLTSSLSSPTSPFRISTLAYAEDLAVLVLRDANATAKFRMHTFGARAVCAPDPAFYASPEERFVTVRRGGKGAKELHWPQRMSSRACVDDPKACPSVTVEQLRAQPWRLMHYPIDALFSSSSSSSGAQFELGFKFRWPLYEPDSDSSSAGLWTAAQATCHVTYYNVTLEHTPGASSGVGKSASDGHLARVTETPSARFLADGFARHLRFGLVGGFLEDAVLPAFFSPSNTHTDAARLAFLNQEVARLAIASASVFTTGTGPTLAQSLVLNRVLARYPFRAVVLFMGVAALYAVFAFVLCLTFSLRRRNDPELVVASANQSLAALTSASLDNSTPAPAPIPSTVSEENAQPSQAQAQAVDYTTLRSEDSVRYRVSIRRFLAPIITTAFTLFFVVILIGRASPSNPTPAAPGPQKQHLSAVTSILMYAVIMSSVVLMLFYGRRVTAVYLSPAPQTAASHSHNLPRDGILVEALRAVGLLKAANLYRGITNVRGAHDSARAVLKEALVVFLSMFLTVFSLAFTTLLFSIRYGLQFSPSSSAGQDKGIGGEPLVGNDGGLGPAVPEAAVVASPLPPPVAFPFWPTAVVVLLVSLYATQALLICLAQSLVAVPISKSGGARAGATQNSGAKVKAD